MKILGSSMVVRVPISRGTGTLTEMGNVLSGIYCSVSGAAMTGVKIMFSRWTRERQRVVTWKLSKEARMVRPEGPRWLVGTKIRDL